MNSDDESVTTLEDLRGDLAGRHKWTPSTGSSVDNAIVAGPHLAHWLKADHPPATASLTDGLDTRDLEIASIVVQAVHTDLEAFFGQAPHDLVVDGIPPCDEVPR